MKIIFLAFILVNLKIFKTDLPVSPLTHLRNIHACHEQTKTLQINCDTGHRIRILDSFYAVSTNTDHDYDYCKYGYKENDCKNHTNLQKQCNGKLVCNINLNEPFYLSKCNAKSQYLNVFYECIPDNRIHDICGNTKNLNTLWGTLQTPNFPLTITKPINNCWCKLQSSSTQRILLSVITFNLNDNTCGQSGLYLQSEHKRSKDCTYLQKRHYYISSSSILYLNFNSHTKTEGFWIIYEASDAKSEIQLNCGDTNEEGSIETSRTTTKESFFVTTTSHLVKLTSKTSSTPQILSTASRTKGAILSSSSKTSRLTTYHKLMEKNSTKSFGFSYESLFNTSISKTTLNHNKTTNTTSARQNLLEKLNSTNNLIFEINTQNSTTVSEEDIFYYDDPVTHTIEINEALKDDINLTNKSEIISTIGFLDNRKKQLIETKNAGPFGRKLGKTELTIIIACIAFITTLTLINLIVYAIKKLIKKNPIDPSKSNLSGEDKNSYDILPGVGEIILWAAKDKQGYLIDINGSWAKIDGQRWIRDNMTVLHNTYKKASMAYRNRFKKKDEKNKQQQRQQHVNHCNNVNKGDDRLIASKGHTPKNGACLLPTVPEALSEYETSSSSSIPSEPFKQPKSIYENERFHTKQDQIETDITESTYYQEQYGSTIISETENTKIELLNKMENSIIAQQSIQIKGEPDYLQKFQNETSLSNEYFKACQKIPPLQRNSPDIILPESSISCIKYSNQPIAIVAPNLSTIEKACEVKVCAKERRVHFSSEEKETFDKCESLATNKEFNQLINSKSSNIDIVRLEAPKISVHVYSTERDSGFLEAKISKIDEISDEFSTTIDKTISFNIDNTTFNSSNDSNWIKRQLNAAECTIDNDPPEESSQKTDISDSLPSSADVSQKAHFNSDEFNFFISAVEKLKATSLFCEEDLKKMSDEQIYEALIEHAKKQRLKKSSNELNKENVIELKDDEEDLPIIMKNLHSVKSLKHYFEIKSKRVSAMELSKIKNSDYTFKQQDELEKLDTREVSVQTDIQKSPSIPVAPPLPNFLFETSLKASKSLPNTTYKLKSESNYSSDYYSTQSLNDTKSLRDKLIREIHNKSMERSKKDSNIFLDERGNLINKTSSRVYSSTYSLKPQKLYKIKESNSISRIEIVKDLNKGFIRSRETIKEKPQRDNENDKSDEVNTYENDQVSELISVSQAPSVCPTLERTGCNQFKQNLIRYHDRINDDIKRNMSFRSDISISSSAISTRSMLSEAKAKLELLSIKKTRNILKQTGDELTHF